VEASILAWNLQPFFAENLTNLALGASPPFCMLVQLSMYEYSNCTDSVSTVSSHASPHGNLHTTQQEWGSIPIGLFCFKKEKNATQDGENHKDIVIIVVTFSEFLNILLNLKMSFSFSFMLTFLDCVNQAPNYLYKTLTPKGPKAIFKPFLKFGQAIVKAIFIKNS
jgi:hypothetical protein